MFLFLLLDIPFRHFCFCFDFHGPPSDPSFHFCFRTSIYIFYTSPSLLPSLASTHSEISLVSFDAIHIHIHLSLYPDDPSASPPFLAPQYTSPKHHPEPTQLPPSSSHISKKKKGHSPNFSNSLPYPTPKIQTSSPHLFPLVTHPKAEKRQPQKLEH